MKYAKTKYNRSYVSKYASGGDIASSITGVATSAGEGLSSNEYNSNGSVNDGKYITGKTLSRAGQGAGIGMSFGPIGALIGGGIGLIGGLFEGITGSKKLMQQRAEQQKEQQQLQQQQIEEEQQRQQQEAQFKKIQQDNYNSAYYTANSSLSNPTGSIYAKGGLLKYGEGGGLYGTKVSPPGVRKSPQQWDSENIKQGYQPSGFGQRYKEYYNPKEYFKDERGSFTKIEDRGKNVDYNNDPTYEPFIKYEGASSTEVSPDRKPSAKVLDPMKQVGFNGMLAPVVEQYGNGGRAPIPVSNRNDKRLIAYNDSLDSYKHSVNRIKAINKTGRSTNGRSVDISGKELISPEDAVREKLDYMKELQIPFSRSEAIENMERLDPINKGTGRLDKAIGYARFPFKNSKGTDKEAIYKKPVQPYFYQQPKEESTKKEDNKKSINNHNILVEDNTSTQIETTPYYKIKRTKDKTGKITNEDYYDFNDNPIEKMGNGGGYNIGKTRSGNPVNIDIRDGLLRDYRVNTRKWNQRFPEEGLSEKEFFQKYPTKYDYNKSKSEDDIRYRFNARRETRFADGGVLNSLASDTVRADGDTHEEGGITLENNGKPFAEVEDNEVIKGNQVYSDRIKLPNGNTMAKEAEKWAKVKGSSEKKLRTSNYRQKNSSNRMAEFADKKLDQLFDYQESLKGNQNKVGKFADGGVFSTDNIVNGLQTVTPFIDNVFNSSMINNTPNIPLPTKKVAYANTAMPMNTTYNVDNDLTSSNNAYRQFTNNLDQTSNSSQVNRGNKLAAYSELLKNNSSIYQTKNNVENQLKNQNNMNIQNVSNYNNQNKQNIDNTNLSQTDQYNWANYQRSQDILNAKSANVANAVDDTNRIFSDYNQRKLDKDRMSIYGQMYPDASVYSRLPDNIMNGMINSKDDYNRIYNSLVSSGHSDKADALKTRYGKKYK